MSLARDRALERLKEVEEARADPKPIELSVTREADLNHPELVLKALVMGHEVTIDGRQVRLANSLELLVGVPKVRLDGEGVEVAWVPMTCTIQGFLLLCRGMSEEEAVSAAFACRF